MEVVEDPERMEMVPPCSSCDVPTFISTEPALPPVASPEKIETNPEFPNNEEPVPKMTLPDDDVEPGFVRICAFSDAMSNVKVSNSIDSSDFKAMSFASSEIEPREVGEMPTVRLMSPEEEDEASPVENVRSPEDAESAVETEMSPEVNSGVDDDPDEMETEPP